MNYINYGFLSNVSTHTDYQTHTHKADMEFPFSSGHLMVFFFGMYILWIGMAFLKAKCISCGKFAVDNNEYSDRWSIKNRQLSAILHF